MVSFTVYGQPYSKANGRRIVKRGRYLRSIKSEAALAYSDTFAIQCPKLPTLLTGDLVVEITIYYASRRPDLDDSLILDLMQGRIYKNDRQVKERHLYWGLDRDRPRAEISVRQRRR